MAFLYMCALSGASSSWHTPTMDRRRHAAHDDNGNNNMQPYFHHHDALMQQWPDPMQVDMHQHHHHQQQQQQPDDISSWNYGGSATPDWSVKLPLHSAQPSYSLLAGGSRKHHKINSISLLISRLSQAEAGPLITTRPRLPSIIRASRHFTRAPPSRRPISVSPSRVTLN